MDLFMWANILMINEWIMKTIYVFMKFVLFARNWGSAPQPLRLQLSPHNFKCNVLEITSLSLLVQANHLQNPHSRLDGFNNSKQTNRRARYRQHATKGSLARDPVDGRPEVGRRREGAGGKPHSATPRVTFCYAVKIYKMLMRERNTLRVWRTLHNYRCS